MGKARSPSSFAMICRLLVLVLAGAAAPRSCVSMATSIRTGDTVFVLAGDDKGATGKVISIDSRKSKVTVEGVNMRTKHVKPMKEGDTGSILKRETAIHISNVRLADDDDAPLAEASSPVQE